MIAAASTLQIALDHRDGRRDRARRRPRPYHPLALMRSDVGTVRSRVLLPEAHVDVLLWVNDSILAEAFSRVRSPTA